jgi:hypothetical protein
MNTSVAALGLIVFAKAEHLVFESFGSTEGGHGGPPLQYVLWPLIHSKSVWRNSNLVKQL